MKAIVCGGRDYLNKIFIFKELDKLNVTCIVTGGATGADQIAEDYAIYKNIKLIVHRAKWSEHGKAAGPIRNKKMLTEENPDIVIAFPGGRGTADMISQAKNFGVKVLEIVEQRNQILRNK